MFIKHIVAVLSTLSLSACMIDGTSSYTNHTQPTTTPGSTLYPESYENVSNYTLPVDTQPQKPVASSQNVVVPESYHVGAYHSPISHTDADRQWIHQQNPQAYTIQLARSDKASQVAGVLLKAPKGERTAEVAYQQGSKKYYQGFYGSYTNYEEAQQALNALPEDLKQHADIQSWNNVQKNVGG